MEKAMKEEQMAGDQGDEEDEDGKEKDIDNNELEEESADFV